MKMSSREKKLLGTLATIFVCVMYYQFVYTKQVEKVEKLTTDRNEVEAKYNEVMETINNLENRKSFIKILKAKILDKSGMFYPELIQEKVILELDKFLNDSKLKGSLSFSQIEVKPVEIVEEKPVIKGESTFKPLVDAYNNKSEAEKNDSKEAITTNNDADDSSTEKNEEVDKETIEQLQVTMNFNGTYEGVKAFIKSIEGNDNKIIINNITIGQTTDNEVSGSMVLEFYAIPKITNRYQDNEYLKWTLQNIYGKDTLFSAAAATGANEGVKNNYSDFRMMVKPESSELPTLIFGRGNDDSKNSYIYVDNNSVQEMEVIITEKEGKYFYKYRAGNSSYPKEYASLGAEFIPNSKNIVIEIDSEGRVGQSDNSGVKVRLLNDTDKTIDVIVKSDDKKRSRVTVEGEGKEINIIKK